MPRCCKSRYRVDCARAFLACASSRASVACACWSAASSGRRSRLTSSCPCFTSSPSLKWTAVISPVICERTCTVVAAITVPMLSISSGTVFRSTCATVTGTAAFGAPPLPPRPPPAAGVCCCASPEQAAATAASATAAHHVIRVCIIYSNRSASIGSSAAAFRAG